MAYTAFNMLSNFTKLYYRHPRYFRHLVSYKLRLYNRFRWIKNAKGNTGSVPPPLVYKCLLTYRCNLSCRKCMLWGESGCCKEMPREEIMQHLDWNVLRDLIHQVSSGRPTFIFSGGEPLLYPYLGELVGELKKNKCFAIFCTNGMLLSNLADYISNNLYVSPLVSLDGCRKQNDQIRGKGVYDKVTESIRELKALKSSPYIGVQFTVQPENVGCMYDFCRDMIPLGIDWIVFNPLWHLTQEQADAYNGIMIREFGVLRPQGASGYVLPSRINYDKFTKQLTCIRKQKWPIQISCYLSDCEDMAVYTGCSLKAIHRRLCYKQWVRMDITPSGNVTPCALFPDIILGNIAKENAATIWNNKASMQFREKTNRENFFHCRKCDSFYLYNPDRLYL